MAQFYKVLKADPLGDPWTPNAPDAKPIQNYWCQVENEELAVSIGKQVGNTLAAGEYIYGDLMKAVSQKGTDYWKFKSQKVPEGVTRPASTPAQATAQQATGVSGVVGDPVPGWFVPYGNMIREMYGEPAPVTKIEAKMPVSQVDDALHGATPVDDATKEQLAGLFPDEPEVPEGV